MFSQEEHDQLVQSPDQKLLLLGEPSYPRNHVGRGWGIRNGAMGAARLPKILVLTIDDLLSAQAVRGPGGRAGALDEALLLPDRGQY